ncbi:translation initiation factor [Agriterribacter sp.]|uniref:translation initiation factor n=1 Tax=Agriterribacter sp. TaxID=2821509 RepID=UPI002BA703AB|nr:translation initiation factor [Agriterribacter sp.]HRO47889.1 translation initiation factor [Agriterribacter sp.]HRQ15918.1 translation initiation factor [Agriterribacter sp.]
MSKKNKPDTRGYVFSTDPSFSFEEESADISTLPPAQQPLRIVLDTKRRAGKTVTILYGFKGSSNDLEALGKKLKNYCGTGGAVKDGEIIVQGDQRDKVLQWLQKNDYRKACKV